MASTFGARRGDPEYDRFRTGLTYRDVHQMLYTHDPDSSKWRYRRRGTVLGFWHQLKQQLWHQVQDQQRKAG